MDKGFCCTPGEKRCGCDDGHLGKPFERVTVGSTDNMVRLDGGIFRMGTGDKIGYPDEGEGPVREVAVDPFYMDPYSVSNADFAKFVEATAYETDAKKFGYSYVFHALLSDSTRRTLDLLGHRRAPLEPGRRLLSLPRLLLQPLPRYGTHVQHARLVHRQPWIPMREGRNA